MGVSTAGIALVVSIAVAGWQVLQYTLQGGRVRVKLRPVHMTDFGSVHRGAAAEAVRNVRQLVAVVVVLARATSAVLDALQSVRAQPVSGVRTFRYPEEADWEEAD